VEDVVIRSPVVGGRGRALIAKDSAYIPHVDVPEFQVVNAQGSTPPHCIKGLLVLAPNDIPDEACIVEDDALPTQDEFAVEPIRTYELEIDLVDFSVGGV
jgi:hypothetical protein